jgi:hypothetical protein
VGARCVSRYYVDKFLFRVDRDPILLAEYKRRPREFVSEWELGMGRQLNETERSSALHFTDEERRALEDRDIAALYAVGAHPFLLLTIMVPIYAEQFPDFLAFAHDFRDRVAHLGRPEFRT